jgi:hypothetical protein
MLSLFSCGTFEKNKIKQKPCLLLLNVHFYDFILLLLPNTKIFEIRWCVHIIGLHEDSSKSVAGVSTLSALLIIRRFLNKKKKSDEYFVSFF